MTARLTVKGLPRKPPKRMAVRISPKGKPRRPKPPPEPMPAWVRAERLGIITGPASLDAEAARRSAAELLDAWRIGPKALAAVVFGGVADAEDEGEDR